MSSSIPDRQLVQNFLQQRRFEEAKPVLEALCKLDPRDAQSWFNLGLTNVELGDLAAGIECFRTSAGIEPDRPIIHYNLARTQHMAGRLEDAEAGYRRAIALAPGMAAAHCNLGNVLTDLNRHDEAVDCFRAALEQNPTMSEAHYNLCEAFKHLQRLDEAYAGYVQLLEENPAFAEAHAGLGTVLLAQHRVKEAKQSFEEALRLKPGLVPGHYGLALCYKELGLDFKAEACFRRALQHDTEHVPSYMGLARLLVESAGLYEQAYECYQAAMRLSPQHPTAAPEAVNVLEKLGRFDEAWQRLQELMRRPDPPIPFATAVAVTFADLCNKVDRCDGALAMVEQVLARGDNEPMEEGQRIVLHFAAGRILDNKGQYDAAFAHYARGNTIAWDMAQRQPWLRYDDKALTRTMDETVATFTPAFMRRTPRATHGSDRPVFIVGMPRSGTTLIEQIIASHPDVHGAGELSDLSWLMILSPELTGTDKAYPGCLESLTVEQCNQLARCYLDRIESVAPAGARRVTDKMPDNFRYLGVIELLFPQARVIHCVRDPVDTCLSCYFQAFVRTHNYQHTFDLRALAHYYGQYRRVMDHWRSVLTIPMLEIRYEDVVADQEGATRRLLEFCGLPWDDACLRYYESKRLIHTASYDQVRQPIYDKSVGRWRNYERHLGPLLQALPAGDRQPP